MTHSEFMDVLNQVKQAIKEGIHPVRIRQGSSGSYFVRNTSGEIVGVFKPKNEEPYEASASIVDRRLKLNIVPRTEIVELASEAFYYGPIDRSQAKSKGYPNKIGSLQIFLKGFKNSNVQMKKIANVNLTKESQLKFQTNFEKLVILDYVIRNTGLDNWMIYYEPLEMEEDLEDKTTADIYITAIDHGLAFPFKHPDNWRSYPFGWYFLSAAKVPFSQQTIDLYLPILKDNKTITTMIKELKEVAKADAHFDSNIFQRQMALMRGQIHNLIRTFEDRGSPVDLVQKPLLMIHESSDQMNSLSERTRKKIIEFVNSNPCFSSC
ncbi:Phosphatidylinositol 3-/4-kinase, catalytic domain-containing protein [Rozella allomycis CSF55]|uniref:Phosphatidylinositol 4-kinase n=1 Tax=Rozella allomycis (strain CSF55) TaxID=988480 RepID=A0A075B5F7_ROZAC|nr:Phosphatidylinositol 3-/4-kinase, catalytic domain-containing protein [Rozella allomycis CSF55]|eukprot:EPZ37087.1 Phosphatidylinositol 3-/4-kinase, catalytic domain-containing protein [Rozella allomycis CSF55]